MAKASTKINIAAEARKAGIPQGTVYARLRRGWSVDKAITEPVHEHKRPKVKRVSAKTTKVINDLPRESANTVVDPQLDDFKRETKAMAYTVLAAIVVLLLVSVLGGMS